MLFQQLERVFIIGGTEISDPCPGQPLTEAVRALSRNFPQFRKYKLYEEDGEVKGGKLSYTMETPPPKSNG